MNTNTTPGEHISSDGIIIHPASPSDAEGVANCLAIAFAPYRDIYTPAAYQDTVLGAKGVAARLDKMTILVAESESAGIVGTLAFAAVSQAEGHLRGMAVVPNFQGRGVAKQLLVAAETALDDRGCLLVTLDVTEPLERAIRFYRRNGYRPSGVVKEFFGMPLFEYVKHSTA